MSDLFPPVDYHSTRTGRRFAKLRTIPFRIVLPNLVTLLALCAGLTAIRMANEARWEYAVGAVVLAAILDAIDGRVARWLKGTSRFGAELDSLADFVNFGVVPGILLYIWVLHEISNPGWIAVLAFAIACALRLARFNVMSEKPKPDWEVNFFTGIPAPAGAIAVLLPLYIADFVSIPINGVTATVIAIYVLLIAFMMVSTIPTFSGKKMGTRVPSEQVIPLSVGLVLLVTVLIAYPFKFLALIAITYLVAIPFIWRWHGRLKSVHLAASQTQSSVYPPAPESEMKGPDASD
jgi:CDP-diacylglycerol--serine O-phosphatidyltransferase